MWAVLLAMILVYLVLIKTRERFLGFLPDALTTLPNRPFVTTDPNQNSGYEVYSTTPNTCPRDRPELDAGLCYQRCRSGYRGVGPVCWANSQDIGVGIPVELESCPDGWNNDGLICREPIRCATGWDFFKKGCSGGRLKGRLDGGGVCGNKNGSTGDHPDKVAGLCYRKCPPNLPSRIPGMPYRCYAGGPLSYERGVGTIPPLVTLFDRTYSF